MTPLNFGSVSGVRKPRVLHFSRRAVSRCKPHRFHASPQSCRAKPVGGTRSSLRRLTGDRTAVRSKSCASILSRVQAKKLSAMIVAVPASDPCPTRATGPSTRALACTDTGHPASDRWPWSPISPLPAPARLRLQWSTGFWRTRIPLPAFLPGDARR